MISLAIGISAGATAFSLGLSALAISGAFLLGAGLGRLALTGMEPDMSGSALSGQNVTVREPAVSRKIVYGKNRVGGAVVFIDSSGDENKFLHLVIAFAGHAIESYEQVLFGDKFIWGDETTAYNDKLTTVAGSATVTLAYTGTAHVGESITFTGVSTVGGLNLNGAFTISAVNTNDIEFIAGSDATSAETGGGTFQMVRRGYQSDWADYAELNFYDGTQTAADSNLVSRSAKWTNDHILKDTAYIYVRLKYDVEENNQLPNVSVLMKGKKVHNPVSGLTEFTSNPALCVRDYLLDTKYGLGETADAIDAESLSAAVSVCDQDVALSGGTTEKRYTLNGVIDTSKSRKQNITNMLKCMSGQLVYSSATYFITPAYYRTPTVTIDESLLSGAIKVKTKQSRRQLYNAVKGNFISSENNYVVSDFPAQVSSTFAAEDGDPIYMDLTLPFVVTQTHAQRLARISLLQSRQQTTITLPCNLSALKFKAGDNIMVTNAKMGYVQKVFEVVGYELGFSANGEISVNVDAIETASAIYDWSTSDEEDFLAGGEISLYDGTLTQPPTNLTVTPQVVINDDGTTIENININWTASADAFVVKYDVEWSTDGVTFYGSSTENTNFAVSPAIAGLTYFVRVRAVNNLGVKSVYVTATGAATGDTTAPAVPTNLASTAGVKEITLTWTNPNDLDFSNVVVQRKVDGGTYANIASVAGQRNQAASFTNGGLTAGTLYHHRLASVDYSGNQSAFITGVTTTPEDTGEQPRAQNGYIYKIAASASQPATPTATSYNYDTGSFGGLTADWQNNPPAVTGADGKYWAASFTVTEATYEGAQTIVFSQPFVSYNFDGLVTFTNLNNELADPDSTEITTIDGGLIKTGKVDASRVEIDGVGIDTQTVGGVTSLIIGDDGVTTVKIDDAAITTAKINDLAVDTIKIADQAVTIPSSTTDAGSSWNNSTAEIVFLTHTWTGTGAETELLWRYTGYELSPSQITVRVKLNGSTIKQRVLTGNNNVIDALNVTSVVGTNTVTITAQKSTGTTSGGSAMTTMLARSLELKK